MPFGAFQDIAERVERQDVEIGFQPAGDGGEIGCLVVVFLQPRIDRRGLDAVEKHRGRPAERAHGFRRDEAAQSTRDLSDAAHAAMMACKPCAGVNALNPS